MSHLTLSQDGSHPSRGNFAHRMAPGTTFGFGQNILEANHVYWYPYFQQQAGMATNQIEIVPAILYMFSDSLSLYMGLPLLLQQKNNDCSQRGVENLFVQGEYVFIDYTARDVEYMGTLVANVSLPTTHLSTHCSCLQTTTLTATAPTSFFIGVTASRLSEKWYLYGSAGTTLSTTKDHTTLGAIVYYQWGVGRNLGNPGGITTLGSIEFNGIYSRPDMMCDTKDKNSGGNIIYIGPTLCLTGDHWFLSGGIQAATVQQLNGIQNKTHYRTLLQLIFQF
jgi:hypothetical protein